MQMVPVSDKFAIVDDDDYELVMRYKWYLSGERGGPYAQTTAYVADGEQVTLRMHTLIMDDNNIDHRDCNGLNNTRTNLRKATASQNMMNTRKQKGTASKFKGVHRQSGRWKAQIYEDGKNTFLGLFNAEVDAAHAYDAAARKKSGEFARVNFPDETEKAHLPLLVQVATQCMDDSERWFGTGEDLTHHLLGIAGELGECIELWKKVQRGSLSFDEVHERLAEELADVFIYVMNVAGILDVDLFEVYKQKRARNEVRFGGQHG